MGLELGFLNNRINFVGDWYKRNNFDLIGPAVTQGVGGFVTKYGNIATMKSDGFELSLTTTNVKTRSFSWTTNVIYSHSHNIVTELLSTRRLISLVSGTGFARQGYPNHSIFSIPFKGLNKVGLPTFLDQEGNISVTGIYFQESDPEKLNFLEFSGTSDPTDVGSLGNTFQLGGFRLNVFITGSFGNVVRLDPVFKSRYDDLVSTPKEFRNRCSTERIASGDFIRLKEVSLSYDLPAKAAKSIGLNTLSVKLQATNLFLLYADKKLNGQDPEFFNTGGVAVPMAKQFTMTLKIGI